MTDREKVIKDLERCVLPHGNGCTPECEYHGRIECCRRVMREALELLRTQMLRVMTEDEVTASKEGSVLWVEERQGVKWNLFPLEIYAISTHPDTGTHYLFFVTYDSLKKFECDEYNQTWCCWTSRPSREQREATPWP